MISSAPAPSRSGLGPRNLTIAGMDRAVTRPAVVERSPADREIVVRALRSLALELYDHQLEDAGDHVDSAADALRGGDHELERACLWLAVEVEPKIGKVCLVQGLLR